MSNCDELAFTTMMTDIYRGCGIRRFNMVTEVSAALATMRQALADHSIRSGVVLFPDMKLRHVSVHVNKSPGDRFRRIYTIQHLVHGWTWMSDVDVDFPVSLKHHLKENQMGDLVKLDLFQLSLEMPPVEMPGGQVRPAYNTKGWLYDPKNHFWKDPA